MSSHSTEILPETALVIHPVLPRARADEAYLRERLEEAAGLARAIQLDVLDCYAVKVSRISPGSLLSKGGVEKIAAQVAEVAPSVVIIDGTLSPVQQRNLEKMFNCKVIDRTGLILEIFGARAQTKEGRIQVDLAMLEYQKSRLVKAWSHLERQRGATGSTGGPGETQIEIDRRLIVERIAKLKKELVEVRRTRNLAQASRAKVPFPVVALMGYTNAGKSTLFNRMTGAGVFAEDLLFATLDPTMRKIELTNGKEVILSDTVGFISDLPTHLVEAFRATLEQVTNAEVIVHVRDISRPDHARQAEDVVRILKDLGVEYEADGRIIEVWNKIDQLNADERADVLREAKFKERVVPLSALSGEGVENFSAEIAKVISQDSVQVRIELSHADGKASSWLYEHADVTNRVDEEALATFSVTISPRELEKFKSRFQARIF